MQLSSVVPWGRSLAEYRAMFALSDEDLEGLILGCGDGAASFNAELSARGGRVLSVDPIYQFSAAEIQLRIRQVYPGMLSQLARRADQYLWRHFHDPGHLGSVRMSAMNRFLEDYPVGSQQGRYIDASVPELPCFDREYDLALCSHLLFVYSEQIDLDAHISAISELCRVAREVRIYPLVAEDGRPSAHLPAVIRHLATQGLELGMQRVDYQFQKGACDMLWIKSPEATASDISE